MALKFDADTREVLVRVPAVGSQRRVVAVNARREELAARDYSARPQADGSWLMSFTPGTLARRAIMLEARSAGAAPESLGCIVQGAHTGA
jgi:hypothetical protein